MKVSNRQRRIAAQKLHKKQEDQFQKVDLALRPFVPNGMTRAYRNNRYTVMVYDNSQTTHGPAIQVLIQNHTNTPIVNHWREIQRIKNEIFGSEVMAIEYFPAETNLIDQHNIYWIWIFPEGVIPVITQTK